MKAGNHIYNSAGDIADIIPVFPLEGALLLPGSQLPLNLFESRYLEMIDHALASGRLIGMIQPQFSGDVGQKDKPNLCKTGCVGRITSYSETGDGRYVITLHGVARFTVLEELDVKTSFRQCKILPFEDDLAPATSAKDVDRAELLGALTLFLKANELEADWDDINGADNETLVNALSVMAPYGAAEKQALLEAPDLPSRAATLVAITELALSRAADDEYSQTLQ